MSRQVVVIAFSAIAVLCIWVGITMHDYKQRLLKKQKRHALAQSQLLPLKDKLDSPTTNPPPPSTRPVIPPKSMDLWKGKWSLLRQFRSSGAQCVRNQKLKICCRKGCCEGVIMVLTLTISKQGSITKEVIKQSVRCNEFHGTPIPQTKIDRVGACYLRALRKLSIPKSLWGQTFDIRLGSILKC